MTDPIDKVDYYESFEIYKNATQRITEKARRNRSFSFDDTPVDPRRKVIGHNISHDVFSPSDKEQKIAGHGLEDLKADGYTPKVKRLSFGVVQRKVKTKQERVHERYLAWCEAWELAGCSAGGRGRWRAWGGGGGEGGGG